MVGRRFLCRDRHRGRLSSIQAAAPVVDERVERVAQRLRALDTDAITPLQALTILAELKKDAE